LNYWDGTAQYAAGLAVPEVASNMPDAGQYQVPNREGQAHRQQAKLNTCIPGPGYAFVFSGGIALAIPMNELIKG
jgi:hypothetical protein